MIPTISSESLQLAQRRALSVVQCLPLREEAVVQPLQTLLGAYPLAYDASGNHDAAVYIAAKEARRTLDAKPSKTSFTYPTAPGQLARGTEWSASRLAYYCEQLARTAKEHLQGVPAQSIGVATRTYNFGEPLPRASSASQPLIGLDAEWASLESTLRSLFLYDPRTGSNEDEGRFPASIVLSGPPGTGKSTLLRQLTSEAAHLSRRHGTAVTTIPYDASNFSSYFGKSTRLLKKLLERVRDPRGVGIFIMEDADMVLQSRDEHHKTHGLQEVQQYLMNELSGIKDGAPNWLALFTTNRVPDIDEAMRQRFAAHYYVDPFAKRESHKEYFSLYAQHLPLEARERLATLSYESGLRGRSLRNVITSAQSSITPRVTDEELQSKKRLRPVPLPTEEHIRTALIAAQRAARGTRDS